MKWFVLILACMLALGACATEEASSDAPTTPEESASPDTPADTPAKEPEDEPSGNSATAELMKYLGNRGSLEWKIAYTIDSRAEGQTFSGTMTQYLKGENKMRTDMTTSGIESQVFFVNDVFTSCTKFSGSWSCTEMDTVEDTTKELEENFEESPDDFTVVPDGTKTVAGYNTKCFKMTQASSSAVMRYCFSADSLPLYVKAEIENSVTEMEATSVAKSVFDSVFTPPAKATKMSDSSGTSIAGGDACSYCDQMPAEYRDQCLASC